MSCRAFCSCACCCLCLSFCVNFNFQPLLPQSLQLLRHPVLFVFDSQLHSNLASSGLCFLSPARLGKSGVWSRPKLGSLYHFLAAVSLKNTALVATIRQAGRQAGRQEGLKQKPGRLLSSLVCMMSLFRKQEEEGLGSGVLELERLSKEGIQESFGNKKCFQENGRMECERVQGEKEGIGMIMPVSPVFTMDTSFAAMPDSSMAVPMCDLSVDATLPDSALNLQVRGVCKALLRRWTDDMDVFSLSITKISGGITNMLLKVELEGENGSQLPPVTVRVFGPNTDAVIDRDRELQAINYLSLAGFGAKLLGVFANGMVQSFIFGVTLEPRDMPKTELVPLIAAEVRRLHELDIPGSKQPQLWHDIYKFIDRASGLTFDDSKKQKQYETISFSSIWSEVEEIKEISDTIGAPVVFAHNDLLSGNLMFNKEEGKIYIIDYEYGSYSYRGYDIANHFNEYAGFECDYSLYPSKDKQFHFFRHYLSPGNPEKATDRELEDLYAECNFFSLASHMYWAVWAIVQARFSTIDFDYLAYFYLRFDEYKKCKEEVLSLTHNYLASGRI